MNIKSILKKIRKDSRKLMALSIFFSQFVNVFLPIYVYSGYGRAFASEVEVQESSESVTTEENIEEPSEEEVVVEEETTEQEGDILEDGASDFRPEEEDVDEEESDEEDVEEVTEVEELVEETEEEEVVEEETEDETDVEVLGAADGTLEIEVVETYQCMANALNPCVITDKDDYGPTEVVLLEGHGYEADTTYTLRIWSDDEPEVEFETEIETDENGSFDASYQLDGTYRPQYYVEVLTIEEEEEPVVIAETSFTDSHIISHECTEDLQGANDEPGQKDLNEMCVDETNLPTSIDAEWNWDDTGWSGANTGDACALFDTDGDGFANFASCVTVEDDPAVQASGSPRIFTCNDTKADRCAGASLVAGPYDSACSVSIVTPQTFASGGDSPNDTRAECTIQLDEVGGDSETVAELIDVCSYPSQQPNSDPSDCIIFEPGTGRLEVIKDLIPAEDTGLFNLQIDGTTEAADVGDGGTTGEKIFEVGRNGTTFTVGETAGTSTSLLSYATVIVCKDLNGTGATVASGSNAGPLNVLIEAEDDVVCTITNTLQNGTLRVHKITDPTSDTTTEFEVTVSGTGTITGDATQTVTGGSYVDYDVTVGTYDVTEGAVEGWDETGNTCDDVAVAGGQTAECTITNTQRGSISGYKYVDEDGDLQTEDDQSPVEGLLVQLWKWVDSAFEDTGLTDTTDEFGFYSFLNLLPGIYQVREVLSSLTGDWISLTGTESANITVDPGESDENNDFVNFEILPGLSTVKTLSSGDPEVLVDDIVTFDIEVTNTGNVTLYNVIISDIYDYDYLEYISSSPDIESSHSAPVADASDYDGDGDTTELISTLTWNIGDLEPGESYTLTLTFEAIQFTDDIPETTYTGNEAWTEACLEDTTECSEEDEVVTDPSLAVVDIDALGGVAGTKFVDVDGDGQWGGEEGVLGGVTINLLKSNGEGYDPYDTTVTVGDGTYSFGDLPSGDYRVCEEEPFGYVQTFPANNGCHDFSITDNGEAYEDRDFGNQGLGTITVVKDVVPNSRGTFDFTITGDLIEPIEFTLGDGGSDTYPELPSGTYSVTEDANPLYTTTIECVSDIQDVEVPGSLELDPGETITCTFTNTRNTGNIIVTKLIDADGDLGTEDDQTPFEGWTMDVDPDGQDTSDPTLDATDANGETSANDIKTGTYWVSEDEDGPTNDYHFLDSYCTLNEQTTGNGGTSSFNGVEVATDTTTYCTFINARDRGTITVIKNVDWNESGQIGDHPNDVLGDETWTWDISGGEQDIATGQTRTLLTDTYTLSEDVKPDYHLVGWSCDNDTSGATNSIPVTIESDGQDITCTITNAPDSSTITVVKDVDSDGDGVVDEQDSEDWTWDIDGSGDYSTGSGNPQSVVPGEYLVSEDQQEGYTVTGLVCNEETLETSESTSVDLGPGEDITCTFTNTRDTGTIIVHKIIDIDGDLETTEDRFNGMNWEMDVDGQEGDTSDPAAQDTDDEGEAAFEGLKTGEYTVSEKLKGGYDLLDAYCDGENGVRGRGAIIEDVAVGNDEIVHCYFINSPDGEIHGQKWHDENGDGIRDFEESVLGGWKIFLDEDEDQEWDDGEQFTFTDSTEAELGWYLFDHLFPGTYTVCEEVQDGWVQTSIPTCHTVVLPVVRGGENACPGPELQNSTFGSTCDFGNTPADFNLLISKSNDTGGLDQQIGDTVLFTLIVENESTEEEPGATAYDVQVTDLPSEGFEYVDGSWTASSSIYGVLALTEPTYASPGVWDLGDMEPGEIITLTYQALITSIVDPGTYKDLAWAQGENIIEEVELAQAQAPGDIGDENFVGTEVIVIEEVEPDNPKVEVDEKTITEEVLGASTLPATGADSIWLVSMVTLLITGISMIVSGLIIKNKRGKNNKAVLNLIAAFALGAILNMGTAHAASTNVQIEDPASPVSGSFELEFVALDTDSSKVLTATCQVDKPGAGGFEDFDLPAKNLGAGGSSDSCDADGSVLTTNGVYAFKVVVTGGSTDPVSDETSTTFDSSPGPEAPDYLRKEKDGQCQYELEFRTEDDGKTESVVIYRDDDKEFTADDAHKIKTINIGPDEEETYENNLFGSECGQTFYYAIRAFDGPDGTGKGSPVVPEDDIINTETVTIDGGTTTEEGETIFLAGSGTQVTTEGGTDGETEVVTEGDDVTQEGEEGAAEDGEVLGLGDSPFGNFLKWLLIILAIIGLVLFLLNRRKR